MPGNMVHFTGNLHIRSVHIPTESAGDFRRQYAASQGLDHDSDVMIDKLTTVRRSNVQTRVGRLTAEQLVEIERAIMAFLGLAR